MNTVFESLRAFCLWLGSSGGIIAILSFLAERCAWFQNLAPKTKQALFFGASVLLPQISLVALDLLAIVPAEAMGKLETHFQAIMTSVVVIGTLLFSEAAHAVDKRVQAAKS